MVAGLPLLFLVVVVDGNKPSNAHPSLNSAPPTISSPPATWVEDLIQTATQAEGLERIADGAAFGEERMLMVNECDDEQESKEEEEKECGVDECGGDEGEESGDEGEE